MKNAADFRSIAREALAGRWGIAVGAGFLASLMGAISSGGANFNASNNSDSTNLLGQEISNSGMNDPLISVLITVMIVILVIVLVVAVAKFILGSVVALGYARFNLDLVSRQNEPKIGTLFNYFKHLGTAVAANLLQTLYILLWSLLFIIPGIIAGYSYAMTNYILAEHPELTASEAIARSKEMMDGNRFRLFCLQLSFIGWDLLCILTLGIGNLWLTPYKQAATAAFYREVSGAEYRDLVTIDA